MRPMNPIGGFIAALATAIALAAPAMGAAQLPDETPVHRLKATRPELEQHLGQLRQLAQSGKLGKLSPEWVRAETSYVVRRLEEGDFRVGDRLLIAVEEPGGGVVGGGTGGGGAADRNAVKSPEQQLTDTFTVGASQELTLPGVGVVSLHGVLRTELEPFLSGEIGRYIKEPVVHARPLISLAVTGGVNKAGYYTVPADALISAVLMAAGGSTKEAKLTDLQIARNGKTVWKGDALRRAVAAGSTLDELQLQPGDEVVVPTKSGAGLDALRYVAAALSIPISIYTISKIF